MSKGNPQYMQGLQERRLELLNRLLATQKENWNRVIAKFAFDHGITKPTVMKYYTILEEAGLLEDAQ